ncbi:hypothetical protein ACN47E_007917 [Coniothyrium glycines]
MANQSNSGTGQTFVGQILNQKSVNDDETVSPGSQSSGDTLCGVVEPGAYNTADNTTFVEDSPSINNIGFIKLNLNDRGIHPSTNVGARYTSPHHRGLRLYADSSATELPPRDFRRDGNHRASYTYNGRLNSGGFRNSRTWISPEAQAQQEFLVIRNSMRRLFKSSDVAKWKLDDYIEHRQAVRAAQTQKLASRARAHEHLNISQYVSISQGSQDMLRKLGLDGNFDMKGNFGRALGEKTIWCKDWMTGKDEIAPWPTMAEMKWEGDDRAKTGVGRFLPLPREQGPPSLPWNQLPVVEQYAIDQICKVPTMEDVYLPVDDVIESDKEYLWSHELDQEIEASLDE